MYNPDEKTLKSILKDNGFIIAAELIELRGFSKKLIRSIINSWDNYPTCMDTYPKVLSANIYNESTHEYVRA